MHCDATQGEQRKEKPKAEKVLNDVKLSLHRKMKHKTKAKLNKTKTPTVSLYYSTVITCTIVRDQNTASLGKRLTHQRATSPGELKTTNGANTGLRLRRALRSVRWPGSAHGSEKA